MLLIPFLAYLVLINLATFVLFWRDKKAASSRQWRTPESTLLTMALVGGSPGALLARRLFRHKTQKQPFVAILYGIVAFQAAIGVIWFTPVGKIV
jgi:uncharacterized membrane protein YsdA (DUF1294 family)